MMLLDEPLSALDSCLRWQMEQELQDVLAGFGGPAVWVSHDRGEVYRNCKRVCVLDRGKSSPAAGLKELMAAPGTVSAARISGCRNFVPFSLGPEAGTVSIPIWGLTLRVAGTRRSDAFVLGVWDNRVRPAAEGDVNTFLCKVRRVAEDINTVAAVLLPEGAEKDAPPLRMELDKDAWAALAGREQVWVSIAPEDVLLLRSEQTDRAEATKSAAVPAR